MNQQQTQQIDQDVKNLVSAMGKVESGTSSPEAYKTRGKSGEYGRYQFMPKTWEQWSQESGITTPLEQASIEEQNKVAYNKVKEWKDSGLNPAQIASKWNSGDENAYRNEHIGVNDQGVSYNTPEHVRKVSRAYEEIKGGLGGAYTPPPAPHDFTPATQTGADTIQEQVGLDSEGGYFNQLGQDFSELGTKSGEAVQRGFSGESDPFSAGYQTLGAGAGAIGDVTDTTLSNLPVVGGAYQGLTEMIGGAVGGAMDTEPGQKITETFEGFSPDTQRNIGATLDLISVIPLFKAFRLGKRGLSDTATGLTSSKVTRQATEEIEGSLKAATQRKLDSAKARGLDPVKVILDDPDMIPEIVDVNGKYLYDTKQGTDSLQKAIDADELALQTLFDKTVPGQAAGISLESVIAKTMADLRKPGKLNTNLDAMERYLTKFFDNTKASLGRDYINLTDLNDLKRASRSPINYGATDPFNAVNKQIAGDLSSSLMKQVEDAAKKAGIEGVKDINQAMGSKLTALDILEDLGGKAIKSGSKGKDGLIKSVGKTIPGVEGIVDYATGGLPSTATRKLRDRRPLLQTGRKGLAQLGGGMALSGQFQAEQQ